MGTAHLRRSYIQGKKRLAGVFEQGKRIQCRTFTLVVYQSDELERPEAAVCIQRRAGKAVVRNRLKRIARELIDPYLDPASPKYLKPCLVALLPKPILLDMPHEARKQSLFGCLKKAALVRSPKEAARDKNGNKQVSMGRLQTPESRKTNIGINKENRVR